jgi:hypothetical protein
MGAMEVCILTRIVAIVALTSLSQAVSVCLSITVLGSPDSGSSVEQSV